MSGYLWIVGLALLIYLPKVAGFCVPERVKLSAFWSDFLRLIPAAVFMALLIPDSLHMTEAASIRLCALGVAGLLALRTRQVSLGILSGLVTLWLLQWVI